MADPWMKFYPSDWRADPKLRLVSMAARGLWMEMICLMHEAEPYGELRVAGVALDEVRLARMVGEAVEDVSKWLSELRQAEVFSVRKNGVIYSRRMEKDENRRRKMRENGKKGGNPSLRKDGENLALDNQGDNTQKPEARSQIEDTPSDDGVARAGAPPPDTPADPKANPQKGRGKARGAARKTRIPDNWSPSAANYAFASQSGLSREEINHEADQFRNSAIASGRLYTDWHAAFRTWLGNTVKWRAERAARTSVGAKPGGQSRGGGIVAAGLRHIGEARGYGQPVPEGRGLGAGDEPDSGMLRLTGS